MDYCCDAMIKQLMHECETHVDPAECPDALIGYFPLLREYGLRIHDGGKAFVSIQYCPWCGTSLIAAEDADP